MMTIQGSPRPQAEIEQMLTEICADLIVAIREGMTLNGAPQPSTLAFVISAAGDLCVVQMLDVAQHLAVFAAAVQQQDANGLVFFHDGWITVDGGRRTEALLVVWATRWGTAKGFAHTYEPMPRGICFNAVLEAESGHLLPYLQVFNCPVEIAAD
jgi:hypothetical protein